MNISETDETVYIQFLNKKNNHKPEKKYFKGKDAYEQAKK